MRSIFRVLVLAVGATALAACGGGDTVPPPEPPQEQGDPCAPNGHIHREPTGDWCHCNRGYLAASEGLACEADPNYVPRDGFDFGDNGEHACWHVSHGPYVTVSASTTRNPRVDDFHTHYSVNLLREGDLYQGTFSYKAFATGDFVIYLSSPDVPVTLKEGDTVIPPVATRPTDNYCEGLKQMVGYELTDRVQYTLILGSTALPQLGMVIENLP